MKHFKILIAISFFCVLASCKKDEIHVTDNVLLNASYKESLNEECNNGNWYGIYTNGNTFEVDTVTDNSFIAGGAARLTSSPWKYYYTSINLNVPSCRRFGGDSARFEVMLKNPSSPGYRVYPFDVTVSITGSKNIAHVYFLGAQIEYSSVGIGSIKYTNLPSLQYIFEEYTPVILELKDSRFNIIRDGILIGSLKYGKTDKLGEVKSINIGFKGAGAVDYVKVFNSKSGMQIMQEDFNTDKISSIIWY